MLKNKTYRRILLTVILLLTGFAGILLFRTYQKIYGPNVKIEEKKVSLYIPTGSNFDTVINILTKKKIIEDTSNFLWVAKKKNYHNHVYPGRYVIQDEMSNNQLVNLLRSGEQEPVDVVFNSVRTKEKLAGIIAQQIEADSASIVALLEDNQYLEQFGFNKKTVYAMFLPNTYEFWWNTSAREFIKRMNKEYNRFWTDSKRQQAEEMKFTPIEVSTLASIVDEETIRDEEMDMIAGVYINRLEKGMRLQADPTVKFALGDFTIKRVLDKHLQVDSPYNTYKYSGLPPGPILIPSIAAIEAVLNYKKHDYLFFVAKPDFSGYHNFSKTHYQHIRNAKEYRKALNQKRIWK
jgi:UPF0755 protein